MRGYIERPEAVWDAWAVTEVDGATRPATENELLQRGVAVLGRSNGVVYAMVVALDHSKDGRRWAAMDLPPGEPVKKMSAVAETRWAKLKRELPAQARARVFRARVIRNAATRVLSTARVRLHDPRHPATRREVTLAEIEEGDVVEVMDLPPIRIQGEPKK